MYIITKLLSSMDHWLGHRVLNRQYKPREQRGRWRRGRGVVGLGWFVLITGVVILGNGIDYQKEAATVTKTIKTDQWSLGLDESDEVQLEHDAKLSGSAGPYSQWASWVPHLCPRLFRRTTTLPGLNLKWEHPTERTIFFTQTSCSSALTPREVYKHFCTDTRCLLLLKVTSFLNLDTVLS